MRYLIAFLAFVCALSPFPLGATEKTGGLEGTLTSTETRGGVSSQTVYTRQGEKLRIENPDKRKPEPINIVDLAAKKLTIVYPHNGSFVVVDLAKNDGASSAPNRPPGFPAPPDLSQAGAPPLPSFSPPTMTPPPSGARPVAAILPPPGFPAPPPMPSLPPMPNNRMASGAPNVPMMPPRPATGDLDGSPELKKTDKTKKIQGFDCACYTLSDGKDTSEIWATADSSLFPFRVIQTNYLNRRFGPRGWEEQWIQLMQKHSLFPLEATFRSDLHFRSDSPAGNSGKGTAAGSEDHGQERLSFKVDKIDKTKIDNEALFKVPEHYYEINAQPF